MLLHQTEVKIVEKSLMLTARQVIEKYKGMIHKYAVNINGGGIQRGFLPLRGTFCLVLSP